MESSQVQKGKQSLKSAGSKQDASDPLPPPQSGDHAGGLSWTFEEVTS